MSDYLFPRLFIKGVESDEYAIIEDDEVKFVEEYREGAYGKVPYEIPLTEIIDLLEEKLKKDILIHLPKEGKAILVPEGTSVKVIRSSHIKVGVSVSEGDEIEVGEEVARGLTTKGEVRRIRSNQGGVVVMVHWEPYGGKDIYHIIIAPPGSVRFLRATS